MNKKYLKDLTREELKKVLEKNSKLYEEIANIIYEDNMFLQEEQGNEILGEKQSNYIDLKDNYSSFYLVLNNWSGFIDNLNIDYLSKQEIQKYNEIKAKQKTLYDMDCYNKHYIELEDRIIKDCESLLEDIENYLHTFEKYPTDNDILDYLEEHTNENYEDCYIIPNNNDCIVYEDVSYTKSYE